MGMGILSVRGVVAGVISNLTTGGGWQEGCFSLSMYRRNISATRTSPRRAERPMRRRVGCGRTDFDGYGRRPSFCVTGAVCIGLGTGRCG